MTPAALTDAVALRIGLAARELPDTDAARLLRVLADTVGLPPTKEKLAGLKVKDLAAAAGGELAGIDPSALKAALARLKGEGEGADDPLPELQPYAEGDLPGSIRVACASDSGELLDGHFGSCRRFLVYQVSAADQRLIAIRGADDAAAGGDKNGYRAALIADCQVLFVASIGGPAAARVVKAGVHPVKKPGAGPARGEVQALSGVIARGAPPWLAKVMGQAPEERVRFGQEDPEPGAGA